MAITKENKKDIIKKFGKDANDSGKTEVQIAILTDEIIDLTEHMKLNKKDKHSKLGLHKKVSKRKSLLKYLKKENNDRYLAVIEKLNLRK